MVTQKDVQLTVIKISVTAIIEELLGIEGRIATSGEEMGHGFKPPIVIHIFRWGIVDYTITGYVLM